MAVITYTRVIQMITFGFSKESLITTMNVLDAVCAFGREEPNNRAVKNTEILIYVRTKHLQSHVCLIKTILLIRPAVCALTPHRVQFKETVCEVMVYCFYRGLYCDFFLSFVGEGRIKKSLLYFLAVLILKNNE